MADIRDGMPNDPLRESLVDPGSVLKPAKPPGSELTLNDDGTASFDLGQEQDAQDGVGHFANLAETLDPRELQSLAVDLLEEIKIDKEARKRADTQYEEGLRRTGLGNDAPGGAPFAGASRVVHPLLLEAGIDYSSRVLGELLPPEGPVKAMIYGTPTDDKNDRAERASRYMNYQLTAAIPSAYAEIEQGYSQQGLIGGFYTKWITGPDGKPDVMVVTADKVHRPWGDGDFYSKSRITHEDLTDKWTYEENIKSGLWVDVLDPATSSDTIEQTGASTANDRIIGQDTPSRNIDEARPTYEISTRRDLGDGGTLPYLVTVDEQTQRVLSVYRNWKEKDANKARLDFLIEWPFIPWRGGIPIGLTHLIGGLSGAATGALRALLDSAFLTSTATGVKLKGGATTGGQNIRPQVGSTVEMQGSLAADDVRKTYMQLEFPPPSPVLFQLLGFLVDAGRGVVRTTFDEFNKMNNEMPVGTANMIVEQGLKTYGAIFGRQHRAMRRFLKQLWDINSETVEDEQIVDQFGELTVSRQDFTGPMQVQPVSDPRIFTDTQRQAIGQLVATRATTLPMIYKVRQAELFMLKQNKVPQPEQFLIDAPEPTQINAAAENVVASQGMPVKAYPGQDHEAHIAQHAAYMQSQLFGSNPIIAQKFLPVMLQHFGDHLSLWYADAMLLATNHMLRKAFEDERITLEALQTVRGLEVQLDRLMAELTPEVLQHADQSLGPVMQIISKAQMLMKQMQPPTPMDPSVVAMKDVDRQTQADTVAAQQKAGDSKARQAADAIKLQLQGQKQNADSQLAQQTQAEKAELERQRLQQEGEKAERDALAAAANVHVADRRNDVTLQTTDANNETQLEITREDNETALKVAAKKIAATGGSGNISDGKGLSK